MENAEVILHASFATDGTCVSIAEKPVWASPQQWYSLLCKLSVNAYEPLAGGRGVFRLSKERLAELKSMQ